MIIDTTHCPRPVPAMLPDGLSLLSLPNNLTSASCWRQQGLTPGLSPRLRYRTGKQKLGTSGHGARVWIKCFWGYWLILILNLLLSIDVDSVIFSLIWLMLMLMKSQNQSIRNRLSPSLKSTDICPRSTLKSSQVADHCRKSTKQDSGIVALPEKHWHLPKTDVKIVPNCGNCPKLSNVTQTYPKIASRSMNAKYRLHDAPIDGILHFCNEYWSMLIPTHFLQRLPLIDFDNW